MRSSVALGEPVPTLVPSAPERTEVGHVDERKDELAPLPSWVPSLLTAVGIGVVTVAAVWCSLHVHPDPLLHRAALFVHLTSLVLGFGAVLSVDWVATLWLLRQRTFKDVLRHARNAHIPIWVGYAGLVASGMLLEPGIADPMTQVKLLLVLVIGWNGALAMLLLHWLDGAGGRPGRIVLGVSVLSASVSQACWWGATVVGFLNRG